MKNLTLVIPAKKESESLPTFLDEIIQLNVNILVVLHKDDHETINSIKNYHSVKTLFQKNKGYGNAIIEGINYSKTEYSCIINADGSMDPKYLNHMLEICFDKDLIFASRYEKPGGGSEDDNFITFFGNKMFSFLGNVIFNLKISDILYTYILGKTKSFQKLELKYNDFRLCVELPIKAKRLGLSYSTIASYERSRIGGKKKVNWFIDGCKILLGMLSFIFKK
tara:strand:- start:745 stop:1413 length:669 start_codon:yes stop_codon:yes gene_type:complete